MATEMPQMPLILGIGVLSEDLSIQREMIAVARLNNIKCLDTARHYVRIPLVSMWPLLINGDRTEEDPRSLLATMVFHPNFRSSLKHLWVLLYPVGRPKKES
jgi:hypothetical protein